MESRGEQSFETPPINSVELAPKDVEQAEKREPQSWEAKIDEMLNSYELPENALGELVKHLAKELLLANQETQKITPEIFRSLISEISLSSEDEELPETHQVVNGQKYAAGVVWAGGRAKLIIYPAFVNEKPEMAAHILAHELGEILQREQVRSDEDGSWETVVDISKYKEIVTARYANSAPYGKFNGDYIYAQVTGDHYVKEMLADDIADFLKTNNWREMLALRLQRNKNGAELLAEIESDPNHPVVKEAEALYVFLNEQFQAKTKKLSKQNKLHPYSDDYGGHAIGSGQFNNAGGIDSNNLLIEKVSRFFWGV